MLLSMWLSVGLKAKKMPFSLLSAACVPARQDKTRHAKSAQCHPRDTAAICDATHPKLPARHASTITWAGDRPDSHAG